jgi:hypothetical protein
MTDLFNVDKVEVRCRDCEHYISTKYDSSYIQNCGIRFRGTGNMRVKANKLHGCLQFKQKHNEQK